MENFLKIEVVARIVGCGDVTLIYASSVPQAKSQPLLCCCCGRHTLLFGNGWHISLFSSAATVGLLILYEKVIFRDEILYQKIVQGFLFQVTRCFPGIGDENLMCCSDHMAFISWPVTKRS